MAVAATTQVIVLINFAPYSLDPVPPRETAGPCYFCCADVRERQNSRLRSPYSGSWSLMATRRPVVAD